MFKRLLVFGTLIVFILNTPVFSKEDTAAFNQMEEWCVVVPSDAIESEKYAAAEFVSFFKLASGKVLKSTDTIPDEGGYIFIGQHPDFKTDDLGEEGLRIVISPKSIIITGGRPRGVLYGVYEFFEKYLDVQFLTTDHTYVPENINDVKIPCETYSYIPDFIFRWTYIAENNTDHKFATRMRTNAVQEGEAKYGGNCGYYLINHSFHFYLPVEKYGKEHPEYFMMQNGRRAVDYTDTWGSGPNPCYASERALKVITQSALNYFKNCPFKKNISLSCVDSHAYCECPECSKVNELHGGTSGSHFDFINRAAKIIGKEYPDKFVGSLAYYHTRHAPTNMKMEDNVQIQLCSIECCTYHALDDPNCPKNVSFYKDMKNWAKICKNIMIWNYNVNFRHYDLPLPNLKSIGSNVRFFRDNNVKGVFMQSAGNSRNSSMSDLKNWVISQCLWKTGSNSWDLALKFCKMHYAESAGPIIEWLILLHNHVALSNVHYRCSTSAQDMNLDTDIAKKAIQLFSQAMDLAQSDELRRRVEKASICAYRLMLETSPYVRSGDAYRLVLPAGYENTLEKYKSLNQKHKTDQPTERATFAEYYKRLEDRKVITLENDVWKLDLLPSWNAKIFNLVYKSHNLELLNPRFEKRRVRNVWDEQAIKGIESELLRDYVITYKVDTFDADSITFSASLADGSTLKRKIWFDKDNPENIHFKTELSHGSADAKEYQFKVIPHFYYEGFDELTDSLSTLVSVKGKFVELKDLTGGKLAGGKNSLVVADGQESVVVFNNQDSFGLKLDFSDLVVEHPGKWWEYYVPRLLSEKQKLNKGQSMTWQYSLTPIQENPAK